MTRGPAAARRSTRPSARPSARPSTSPAPAGARRTSGGRRAAAVVAVVLVVLLVLLGAVGGLALPASAHDALTGSTPADGATVQTPPASVDLTFSQPPLGIGAEVRVTGPEGEVVNDGDLAISDTTVSQPLAADLPPGAYAVVWRVTSGDGHPISGELSFTAAEGTAAQAPATAGGTVGATDDPAGPTTGPTTEPATDATDDPTPAVTEPPGVTEDGEATGGAGTDAGGSSALPWVLGAAVLAAAAVAVGWALRRRTQSNPRADPRQR